MLPASERVLRAQPPPTCRRPTPKIRTARTASARRALEDKWLAEAGGDPVRGEHLRRAFTPRWHQSRAGSSPSRTGRCEMTGMAARRLEPASTRSTRVTQHDAAAQLSKAVA